MYLLKCVYVCFIWGPPKVFSKGGEIRFSAHCLHISFSRPQTTATSWCFRIKLNKKRGWTFDGKFSALWASSCHSSVPPMFVSGRGCGLQDSPLCADHRHSDRHPHDDLHRHREIPGHCVPTENEEAVLAQTSIQDARYRVYIRIYNLKHTVTPSNSASLVWKGTFQSLYSVLRCWQSASPASCRAGVDRLRAGRLTDAVCATVGGRRWNNPPLFPHFSGAVIASRYHVTMILCCYKTTPRRKSIILLWSAKWLEESKGGRGKKEKANGGGCLIKFAITVYYYIARLPHADSCKYMLGLHVQDTTAAFAGAKFMLNHL